MANGKGKTSTARRREVRKAVPKPGPQWKQALRRREISYAAGFVAALVVLGGLVALWHRSQSPYHFGQVLRQPVVVRADFQARDKGLTRARKLEARASEPNAYTPNESLLNRLRRQFDGLLQRAEQNRLNGFGDEGDDQVTLTRAGLAALRQFTRNDSTMAGWEQLREQFIRGVFNLAVLNKSAYKRESEVPFGRIVIYHPDPGSNHQERQPRNDYAWISIHQQDRLAQRITSLAQPFPEPLRQTVVDLVMSDPQPTYRFNQQLSEQNRQQRYEQEPGVSVPYRRGQVLIPAGTKLEEDDLALIKAERQAYHDWLRSGAGGDEVATAGTSPGPGVSPSGVGKGTMDAANTHRVSKPPSFLLTWRPELEACGVFGLMLLIGLGLWAYLFRYYPKVPRNPMRGLAITAVLILCQALAVLSVQLVPQSTYLGATFPTLLVVMVLAIVYDQRLALGLGGIHSLIVLLSLDQSVGFAITLLTGVATVAALLADVRSRSKLVLVGLYAGAAMAGAVLVTGLADRGFALVSPWADLMRDAGAALLAGAMAGLLVQGILPLIERAFQVTTSLTLKELNDASHPLLQRLAQEAPGTYQHSLRLADMTEAAADQIGAEGLLCRVGAMYHDIGKMNKPRYFIENQGGGANRHEKLSPAMSLLIIVGHVKDGIEMAREYTLPKVLRHFIESHHGTTLVEYFYHAAKKQKQAEASPGPSEFEFRYPGPKPQTKEAAIMLLGDSTEAAARTLSDPTPVRLEQLVHRIAMNRLMDSQFDECALTLQELARIEAALTKTLCAIYHARIKYPESDSPSQNHPAPPTTPHKAPAQGLEPSLVTSHTPQPAARSA